MKKPKKNPKLWLLFLIGTMSWGLVISLTLILTSPFWIPKAASYFAENYIDAIDFEIDSLSHRHAKINKLRLQQDPLHIEIPSVDLDYSPSSLWEQHLNTIYASKPQIHLSLQPNLEPSSTDPFSSEMLEKLLKTQLPTIPFQDLTINKAASTFELPDGNVIELESTIQLNVREDQTDLIAQNAVLGGSIELKGKESLGLRGIEINMELNEPRKLLDKLNRSFSQYIPENFPLNSLSFGSIYSSIDWNNQNDVINLQSLAEKIALEETFSIETLFLKSESNDYIDNLSAVVTAEKLRIDDILDTELNMSLSANKVLSKEIEMTAEFDLLNAILQAGKNNYILEEIKGKAQAGLNSLSLQIDNFTAKDFPLSFEKISNKTTLDEEEIVSELRANVSVQGEILEILPYEERHIGIIASVVAPTNNFEALHFDGELLIPQSSINFVQSSNGLSLSGMTSGSLHTSGAMNATSFDTNLRFENIKATIGEKFEMEGNAAINARTTAQYTSPNNSEEQTSFKIPQNQLEALLDLKGSWQESPFSIDELTIHHKGALEMNPLHVQLDLHAQDLKWDMWSASELQSQLSITPDAVSSQTTGFVLNESISATAVYKFDFLEQTQKGIVKVSTAEEKATSEINLRNLFSDIPTTISSGLIDVIFQISGKAELPEMSLQASLLEGGLLLPDSGVSVSGINLPLLRFNDLTTGEGPEFQQLRIDHIEIPPTEIKNLELIFSPIKNYGIRIEKLSFEFCEGIFEVKFLHPIEAPYQTFEMEIQFTNLELKELTKLIPDFKEDISGKIEGFLPISYNDQSISWSEGSAKLMDGTTATLKYSEDGMIAKYIPEITISEELDLNINNALRNLIITDLDFDIRSSAEFNEPTVVIMSGHTNDPEISIPVERIQLNIRAGDLPGLINQSFNASKWIEGIGLAN